MIFVDRALQRRQSEGRPVRVAMVGAGFMDRGVAQQIICILSRSVAECTGVANGSSNRALSTGVV